MAGRATEGGRPLSSLRPGVLIVGNFLSHAGGARGVCEDLAERLEGAGFPVVTTSRRPGRVLRLLDMLSTVQRRRRDFAVAQIDVFSGWGFFWAERVLARLRRLGKPTVLTLHGGDLPSFAERWPRRVSRLLGRATAVTAPSDYLRGALRGIRSDIRLVPNPLAVEHYPFRLRSAPRPRLVWLRAFHQVYDPVLAPRVLAELVADFPDATLEMTGPDKGDGSLRQVRDAIAALDLEDRVTLAGGVPKAEVPQRLARGDIFLNTSRIDNAPVTVLEPMACGLCVVSTRVGGIPQLVSADENALLVPPQDPESMAAAVRRILADSDLAVRLSQGGRRRAEQVDWSRVLPVWERLLVSLAEGSEP